VPRWLYTHVTVPSLAELRVEPDAFANNTKYRMRLISLSFGSPNQTPYTAGFVQPAQHPTWTNRLLVDIGKSGCSDLNLVSGTLTSLCGNMRRIRTIVGDINMNRNWRLPTPYLLPRDEGLRVSVEWIRPQYLLNRYQVGPAQSGEVTFIAKGYGADGYPVMLAGRHAGFGNEATIYQKGDAVLLNSADLFNNGKREIYLTEFLYKEMDEYYDNDPAHTAWFATGNSFNFAWTVNPSNPTFTQFMPQTRHIPTGLLAPMCRAYDGGSESPLVYYFPPDTWLDPKQALSVRLGNTLATVSTNIAIEVHMALAGELEVI
jgi:hypothetical protein